MAHVPKLAWALAFASALLAGCHANREGSSSNLPVDPPDTLRTPPLRFPLVAVAGKDTTVTVGDTVHLRGEGKPGGAGDRLSYAWKIGTGDFIPVSIPETTFIAPASPDFLVAVLRVADTLGSVSLDSARVRVIDDTPRVRIIYDRIDNQVAGGFRFTAEVEDAGRIIGWEWRAGDSGVVTTSDSTALLLSPDRMALPVRVRVLDEDGNPGQAWLDSLESGPIGSKYHVLTHQHLNQCVEFAGRLVTISWISGPDPRKSHQGPMLAFHPGNWDSYETLVSLPMGVGTYFSTGGRLFSFGWAYSWQKSKAVSEFDAVTKTWNKRRDMPVGHSLATAAAFLDGKIYLFGGYTRSDSAHRYHPDADLWDTLPNLPDSGSNLSSVGWQGKVLVFGAGVEGRKVLEYDTSEGRWNARKDAPTAISKAWFIKGRVYCKGEAGFFRYAPESDSWRLVNLPLPKTHCQAVIEDRLYSLTHVVKKAPPLMIEVRVGFQVDVFDPASDP